MTLSIEQQVDRVLPWEVQGTVSRVAANQVVVSDFPVPVGAEVEILHRAGDGLRAEVIAVREHETIVLPFGPADGLRFGQRVRLVRTSASIAVSHDMIGRVIDACGSPIDGGPPISASSRRPLVTAPPSAMSRRPVGDVLQTGVRAIDGMLTIGRGQRIGIFAGSGVGKSTLMGQIVRGSHADLTVVVLVGERGREVREFIERDLGEEGLRRSIVVVATGDEPASLRVRAARAATSIAESFRDQGLDVLLLMDSVTRYATALREIGLAAGEPPATRGYPPSVFADLPRLLERSGTSNRGSVTAMYTVLVEGDDTNEPVSDTVRGILDGHIHLTRRLAESGHWPAIDVLPSISRCMNSIVDSDHQASARVVREAMAAWSESEDLIQIGAYQAGTSAVLDSVIRHRPALLSFLRQLTTETSDLGETHELLLQLASRLRATSPDGGAS